MNKILLLLIGVIVFLSIVFLWKPTQKEQTTPVRVTLPEVEQPVMEHEQQFPDIISESDMEDLSPEAAEHD